MIPAILITAFIILIGRDCMKPADEEESETEIKIVSSNYFVYDLRKR